MASKKVLTDLLVDGNVGIGTTSPAKKLHILNDTDTAQIRLGQAGSGSYDIGVRTGDKFSIGRDNDIQEFTISAGNVGIGTTSPTNKLDIRQSTSGGSDVSGVGAITIGSDNPYWTFRGTATSLQDLAFDRSYAGTWHESMRIQRSTGNVGIGTTSPGVKLDVNGDSVRVINANPRYYLNNSVVQWHTTIATNDYRIHDGIDDRLTIKRSSGNVGIGTISPETEFHVKGSATVANFEGTGGAVFIGLKDSDDGTIGYMGVDAGKIKFQTSGSGYSDKLVIDTVGNVGIGTTTPVGRLQINGNGNSWADSPSIRLWDYTNGKGWLVGNVNNYTAGDFYIRTFASLSTNPTGAQKEFTIKHATGNVGIGNTHPGAKLVVGANVNTNATGIEVNAGTGGGNVLSNGTADNWFPYVDNNNYYSAQDHIFRSELNGNTRLTIKSSGNVGIGTTSPTAKLHVTGTGNFTGLVSGITPVAAANFVTKAYADGLTPGAGVFLPLAGGTMTGVTQFNDHTQHGDQVSAKFGAGNDLQIYHDGNHSYINGSNGAGSLYIKPGSGGTIQLETTSGTDMITAGASAVTLYSSGNPKLATTSTGISVTGDGVFTGDVTGVRGFFNSGTVNVVSTFTSTDTTATLQCIDSTGNVEFGASGNNFVVQPAGGVAQLTVGASTSTFAGDVALTGSGAKIISASSSNDNATLFLSGAGSGKDTRVVFGNNRNLLFERTSSSTPTSTGTTVLTLDINNDATFAGNILIGNTVVNPASGFSDQTGIGLKHSTTVPTLEVSSDSAAMQLGRTSTGGEGQILALRKAGNVIHHFDTNNVSIGTNATFAGDVTLSLGSLNVIGANSVNTVGRFESGVGSTNSYLQLLPNGATDTNSGYIGYDTSNLLKFYTQNTLALYLDASQNATFAGQVTTNSRFNSTTTQALHFPNYTGSGWQIGADAAAAGMYIYNENGTYAMKLTSGGNATFAGDVSLGDAKFIKWGNGNQQILGNNTSGLSLYSNGERMRILTNGNVGIGTTSPSQKLQVDGVIRAESGYLVANDIFIDEQATPYFTNGVADQNCDIVLPNASIWGNLEVSITGSYSNQNTNGKLTKIYACGLNAGGTIFNNDSRISDALGPIQQNINLGEIRWDSATSTYRIRIAHIVSTGNGFDVAIRMNGSGNRAVNLANNWSISSLYTQSTTGLIDQQVYYNYKLGIGTGDPKSKLQVAGGIQMADDTATATADKVGTQRYRETTGASYVDMVMRTSATTYEWINIVRNVWSI